MKWFLFTAFIALACNLSVFSSTANANRPKKVLLYLLDGLGANGTYGFKSLLANGDIPAFQSLIEGTWDPAYKGAYDPASQSGGEIGTETEQFTTTHVGWATIYTGVYANLHGVSSTFAATPANFQDYPPFTRILRTALGDSIQLITHARGFHTVDIHNNDLSVFDVVGLEGAQNLNASLLDQSGASKDELILYYDNDLDEAAHIPFPGGGTGDPGYGAAIESIDNDLAGSLAAILSRPNFTNEDWTVLVASEHGQLERTGGGHGKQTAAERESPLILASKSTYFVWNNNCKHCSDNFKYFQRSTA